MRMTSSILLAAAVVACGVSAAQAAMITTLSVASVSGAGVTKVDANHVSIDPATFTGTGSITFEVHATVTNGTVGTGATGLVSATGSLTSTGSAIFGGMGNATTNVPNNTFLNSWGGTGAQAGFAQLNNFTGSTTGNVEIGDVTDATKMIVYRQGGSTIAVTDQALSSVTFNITSIGAGGSTSDILWMPRNATGTASVADAVWKEGGTSFYHSGSSATAGAVFDVSGADVQVSVVGVPEPASLGLLALGALSLLRRRK